MEIQLLRQDIPGSPWDDISETLLCPYFVNRMAVHLLLFIDPLFIFTYLYITIFNYALSGPDKILFI